MRRRSYAPALGLLLFASCTAPTAVGPSSAPLKMAPPSQTRHRPTNASLLAPVPVVPTSPQSPVKFVLDGIWLPSSEPGRAAPELWLLARFRIPPGYHLYWRNPGQTGLETVAEFSAPASFQLGEVRYPGPQKFRSERGAVSYGYEGETALLAKATPSKSLSDGTRVTFRAHASWLSCSAVCVKAEGDAELALGEHPSGDWLPLQRLLDRLPRPLEQLDLETTRTPAGAEFSAGVGIRLLDYFPYKMTSTTEPGITVSTHGDGTALHVKHSVHEAPIRGVLSATVQGEVRWFTVHLP